MQCKKSGKSYSSSKETTTKESILGQPSEYCNWHLLGLIALNELFAGCLSITCRRCPTKENCIQIGAVLDSYRVFLVCLQEQNSPNTVSSLLDGFLCDRHNVSQRNERLKESPLTVVQRGRDQLQESVSARCLSYRGFKKRFKGLFIIVENVVSLSSSFTGARL